MISRRNMLGTGLALTATAATNAPAWAQNFPSKPIRWIAPFAAGGNYDLTSRLVGEGMSRSLGQQVIVDNRPGAGGLVGAEAAANAPADGYTVVMGSFSVLFVSPYLAGKPSLVPMFAPISLLSTVPMILVGKPGGRFADIRAVLAEAKARPGTVSIGHAGNGTTNHIAILRLEVNEGVKFNIIPYKGSGPGLADLMAGQIDLYMDQLTTSLPHIKSGKLMGMLAMSPGRVAQLPDVPSLTDIGSKPFDGGTTAGVLARVETPQPILATLNGAVVAALKDPAIAAKLGELGAVPRPSTMEEFAAYMKDQEAGVSALVKSGLLKPE
ncbi:MAG: tripartite tricarboxylate transporter substrate binding protein [Reyranella sp.]|uniref:Bug family tripartite tricarboxylate transporter substrate binding protein n=1 Tax=Reyranella sp. TaxID=1929291 RepID=UPI0012222A8F|nr:tripartite tricarboxylate transporter substrate binding protein [Reyranella sp.]TAJ95350.1 MAG: tripartite tricarboxylate transporter substrate binding protein [Reyranella sp.]